MTIIKPAWELRLMRYLLEQGDKLKMSELYKGIPTYAPACHRVLITNSMEDKGWIRILKGNIVEATAAGCLALKEADDS